MEFTKWQGCGNDFVIVDFLDREPVDFAALAVRMCDRHFGVGADGLMIVCPSETADIRMREFNPDGTEPEMCGNGIRCFARCLYDCGASAGSSSRSRRLRVQWCRGFSRKAAK